MDSQQATLAICSAAAAFIWYWYKRRNALSISDIPGPKNPSWIYGHLWWWNNGEAGAVEKDILEQYGSVARWNGVLGEERLWIADPNAMHHVLQSSGDKYEKPFVIREVIAMVADRGLASTEGDTHRRQRRAMNPAFGLVEAKALYPCFTQCSNSLADKLHEAILEGDSGHSAVLDVHSWLSKATLDAIGAGAFDYDFGALEGTGNKFTKSYSNLAFGALGKVTKGQMFAADFLKWGPEGFPTWALERDKRPEMVKLRENKVYAREVATKLIEDKKREFENGVPRKDLLSLLVKANLSLKEESRLSDEEITAQVRTIIFAGHETTAKTLTFALWELAKSHRVQEKLRAEIEEKLGQIKERGGGDFTVNDFDSMPYLLAVGKEILRLYPVIVDVLRVSTRDDILPLSKPIVGVSGTVYYELPVPAGTLYYISTMGYNLNKDIWGPDAYEFRPERWFEIDEKPKVSVGVHGNLGTFSGGRRSCIGWRFAVVEMHTFLVTLLRQFDFSLPDDGREIKKMRPKVMTPVVAGEEHKGPQLPLKISILRNE